MFSNVHARQANDLVSTGTVEVIDVREPSEWAQGHIPGARLVTLAQLRANALRLLPGEGVLFVCAGGVRSQTAARLADQLGIKRVYSLIGGTMSWAKAGLPLEQELSVAV